MVTVEGEAHFLRVHSREVTVSFVSFGVKEPGVVTRVKKKKISYIVLRPQSRVYNVPNIESVRNFRQ